MQKAPSNFDEITRKNRNENESNHEIRVILGEGLSQI